jgi:hypothetical protein
MRRRIAPGDSLMREGEWKLFAKEHTHADIGFLRRSSRSVMVQKYLCQ